MDLFDASNFSPRLECGDWGWWAFPFIVSQVGIWLAYMAIPVWLIIFGRRKSLGLKSRKAFVALFATFILFCGFGHLFDALTFKYPAYRFLTLWHLGTMVASWATAIVLPALLLKYLEDHQ